MTVPVSLGDNSWVLINIQGDSRLEELHRARVHKKFQTPSVTVGFERTNLESLKQLTRPKSTHQNSVIRSSGARNIKGIPETFNGSLHFFSQDKERIYSTIPQLRDSGCEGLRLKYFATSLDSIASYSLFQISIFEIIQAYCAAEHALSFYIREAVNNVDVRRATIEVQKNGRPVS